MIEHEETNAIKCKIIEPKIIRHSRPIRMAETYFSIPQDLKSLENLNVLDYLQQHVWLSSKRQKKCKIVFEKLTNFDTVEWENIPVGIYGLPMVFLGIALVDLFEFPATHVNMTELYEYLENDKVRFRELDFRTWCGVSAFAERLVQDEPLHFEKLELADFQYLNTHGIWYDIPVPLQHIFDVINNMHTQFL